MPVKGYCADFLFTGDQVINNGCIVYEGDRILEAGTKGSIEKCKDPVVLKGYTLMPGLIDAHIHITGFRSGDYIKESLITPYATLVARAIKDLESVIMAGYTTIVDAGSIISLELKHAEKEGAIVSPRIIAAGYPVSQTYGHGDIHFLPPELVDPRTSKLKMPFQSLLCDGPSECRKAARYALRTGADFIKVFTTGGIASEKDRPEYQQMTREELNAIVEEANRAHKFVHAHAEGREGIIAALEAGITRIAHAIYLDEDGISLAKEKNAVIIPTLTIIDLILRFGEASGLPEWAIQKTREARDHHINSIRKAYKEGVKLATGTDFFINSRSYNVYGLNSLEILLLVNEIGLSPIEALKAATVNSAYVAGLTNEIGLLKPGYKADTIAVKGNPLEDPTLPLGPDNVHLVVKNGTVYKDTIVTNQTV